MISVHIISAQSTRVPGDQAADIWDCLLKLSCFKAIGLDEVTGWGDEKAEANFMVSVAALGIWY